MKKMAIALILFAALTLFSQENETSLSGISFSTALHLSYNSLPVDIDGIENNLIAYIGTLELNMDLTTYLTVGIMAGYNISHPKNPVDFVQLPLSLRLDQSKFNGIVFGLNLQSEPFSFGDFLIKGRGEFIYALEFKKEWDIALPLKSGTATGKNRFFIATLDLMLEYQGFSTFSIFAGPRFNLINGKFSLTETIDTLSGIQDLKYQQQKLMGAVAGIVYDPGGNFIITLKGSLLCRTTALLEILYIF